MHRATRFSRIVAPEFQVNVNDDQGVKKGEGKMVEWGKKVKVVVILQILILQYRIIMDLSNQLKSVCVIKMVKCKHDDFLDLSPLLLLAPQRPVQQVPLRP